MQIGELISSRYQVTELLGEGGIGQAWGAIDTSNQTRVVIKVLKPHILENQDLITKFNKEITALKRLDHPNIVKFISDDKHNGFPYLVIEFIDGSNLRPRVVQGGIADLEAVSAIIEQIGEAIQAAHNQGIYHRDLKPENIMLTLKEDKEIVKVIDFGIATVKEQKDEKTQTTILIGTVSYMAPEQVRGKPTAQSDIYAMGVIAYELVTGILPFNLKGLHAPANVLMLYDLQQKREIVRPKKLRPDLSTKADELILQALAFNITERPNSAKEFGKALAKALKEEEEVSFNLAKKETIENLSTNRNNEGYKSQPNKIDVKTSNPSNSINEPTSNPSSKSSSKGFVFALIGVIVFLLVVVVVKFNSINNPDTLAALPKVTPSSSPKALLPKSKLINYSISLSQSIGKGKYKPAIQMAGQEIIFNDGDLIKFNFQSQINGYLYMINEGPGLESSLPKYIMLYPSPTDNNKVEANLAFSIPSQPKDLGIEFFGSKGTEKVWLVFTQEKIPLLDGLTQLINDKDQGLIKDASKITEIKSLLSKPTKPELDSDAKLMKLAIDNSPITIALLKFSHN